MARTARITLCAVAIAACAPYLLLKGVWLAGSRVGIPQDSVLLSGNEAVLHSINGLTMVMDAVVIVLAVALVRPFGRRLPAWLMLGPLWVATGLLTPILVAAPLSGVLAVLDNAPEGSQQESEPFLEGWVSVLVYGGFIVQAVALGALFALYVKDRWGRTLRGRLGALSPPPRTPSALLLTSATLLATAVPLSTHLLWALGSHSGLPSSQAAQMDARMRLVEASYAGFALCAVAAVVLVALRPRPQTRVATVVLLGWVGGSVLTAWGGWSLLMSGSNAINGGLPSEQHVTSAQLLVYAAQMTAGLLVLTVSIRFAHQHLAGREAVAHDRDPHKVEPHDRDPHEAAAHDLTERDLRSRRRTERL